MLCSVSLLAPNQCWIGAFLERDRCHQGVKRGEEMRGRGGERTQGRKEGREERNTWLVWVCSRQDGTYEMKRSKDLSLGRAEEETR